MGIYLLDVLNKLDSNTNVFIKNEKRELENNFYEGLRDGGLYRDAIIANSDKTLYKGRICDMTIKDYNKLFFKEINNSIVNNISLYEIENGILGFKIIVKI